MTSTPKYVLVIEDNQTHWERIYSIFYKYNVSIFPGDKRTFREFATRLSDFARSPTVENLESIRTELKERKFDFIVLDINLLNSNPNDVSGYELKEKIFDIEFQGIPFCYMSNYPRNKNSDIYIEKTGYIAWEKEIFSKVISLLLSERKPSDESLEYVNVAAEPEIILKHASEEDIAEMRQKTDPPGFLTKLVEKEKYKVLRVTTYFIDTLIKYVFYILLPSLFIYGVVSLGLSCFKYHFNPLFIAENVFIVFLPFLIASGFYIFYTQSLSPFIQQNRVELKSFDNSFHLMNLTKKLFISSLISYLFIKLTEIFVLEGEGEGVKRFISTYGKEHLIFFPLLIVCFIIILVLYFIYLDRSHREKLENDKHG